MLDSQKIGDDDYSVATGIDMESNVKKKSVLLLWLQDN